MKKLQIFLAHCNIVFGTVFVALLVLNKLNSGMQFLSSGVTRWFLLLFCVSAIVFGAVSIRLYRRALKLRMARSHMQHMR